VAYPFNKFFNFGEEYADNIDWESAHVLEKVDGSLIKVYFHNGAWCVGTNNTIDANDAELSAPPYETFMDCLTLRQMCVVLIMIALILIIPISLSFVLLTTGL